jgi:hypothetical protein
MKAILEFNLDDADDRMAHLRAIKSRDMAIILWDILHNLNKETGRYIEENISGDDEEDAGFKVREFLINRIVELCEEYNVTIDELVI